MRASRLPSLDPKGKFSWEFSGIILGARGAQSGRRMSLSYATTASKSLKEASQKSVRLYRHVLKSIPYVKSQYSLQTPNEEIKKKLRHVRLDTKSLQKEFVKHKLVKDPGIVDMLTFQGRTELEDTLNMYKTR